MRTWPTLLTPGLAGVGRVPHVALTFDDGPDAASTPFFLELLARLDVRATFFLLGRHVAGHEQLVRETAAAGHELAVHGWDHRPVVLHPPGRLRDQLARTRDLLEDLAGVPVRRYRPPYGVLAPRTLTAARDVGLETVLWSAWGRDWERRATARTVVDLVGRDLHAGGTVLLHDSDRTSALESWRATLAAVAPLVETWRTNGWEIGPLAEHGLA